MTTKKQKQTKDAQSEVAAFIAEVEEQNPARTGEDLPVVIFERDEIHTMTVTEMNDFEGEYGPALCVIGDHDGTRVKTFFGSFEREAFLRFAEQNDFPVEVQMVRTMKQSEKSDNLWAALYIKAND